MDTLLRKNLESSEQPGEAPPAEVDFNDAPGLMNDVFDRAAELRVEEQKKIQEVGFEASQPQQDEVEEPQTEDMATSEEPEAVEEPAEGDEAPKDGRDVDVDNMIDKDDYDKLVPMHDGEEPISVSALKDEVVERRREESAIVKQKQELIRDRQLVNEILLNDGPPTAEQRQALEQRRQQYLDQQHALMLEQNPEWADASQFHKDRDEIVDYVSKWGISKDLVLAVDDAGIVSMLKQAVKDRKKLEKAESDLKQIKSKQKRKPQGRRPSNAPKGSDNWDALLAKKEQTGEIDWAMADRLLASGAK